MKIARQFTGGIAPIRRKRVPEGCLNRPSPRACEKWSTAAARIRKGIDADPGVHATDAGFWKTAKVVMPVPKEIVTMRLDADLLRWFRRERGYQTRINAILRAYMQAQFSKSPLLAQDAGNGAPGLKTLLL